jgi:hypothetical protein
MALDFPASGSALWDIFDAGGPRPEYLLPVLYFESGFRPDVQNHAGAPYYGLNQVSGTTLQSGGVDPSDYLTWPASRQLSTFVRSYVLNAVNNYGSLRSATRVEQANFLPATLKTATSLSSVLASQGDAYYSANAGFDKNKTGQITVQDLANAMAKSAASSAVQSAIAQTYALRPTESPHDPVYGDDFGVTSWLPSSPAVQVALILAAGAGAAWLIRGGTLEDVFVGLRGLGRRARRLVVD